MPSVRISRILAAALLSGGVLAALGAGAAPGQELYNFTVGASASIGGVLDGAESDPGLDQTGFQLQFSFVTAPKTLVGIRYGQISMSDEVLGPLYDPKFSYATIGGEYRFQESYYQSGIFIGLGAYRMDGTLIGTGEKDEDTAIGATFGVTGDFPINKRWSVLGEFSLHYADLNSARLFGFLHGGVGFKF